MPQGPAPGGHPGGPGGNIVVEMFSFKNEF